MGFFSFFARKTPGDKKGLQSDIKGQAYDSTVAADPPVQGTYPVAGNGPNILGQLQRAARKRSEAQLSNFESDATAPAPGVPRSRDTGAVRPNTAPNASAAKAERPKSVGRAWPFLSGKKSSTWTTTGSIYSAEPEAPPPVPSIAAYHYRETSADETPRSPGSIDVLDAQGDIRPYSFHSRVKAAGAREYGEDVAERNLGENGLDLRSEAVKAFYALSRSGQLALRPGGSAVSVNGSAYYTDASADEIDESAPPPVIAKGELSKEERANRARGLKVREPAGSRTSSFNMASIKSLSRSDKVFERSETWSQGAEKRPETHHGVRTSSFLGAPQPHGSGRRRSLNAFVEPPPPPPQREKTKPRPLTLHPSQSNFYMDSASPPPVPRSRPGTGTSRGRRPRSSFSTAEARDFAPMASQRDDSRPHTRHSRTARSDFSGFSSPKSHSSKPSRRPSKRASFASSRRASSPEPLPQGIGRVEIETSVDGALDSPAPPPHIPTRSLRTEPQIYTQPDNLQAWQPFYGSARGEHSHPLTRPSSSSSLDPSSLSRTRSLGGASLPGKPRLDDINEHIPIRTSSLGVGTHACVTPTTVSSEHSSNPFLRPQSQHTADTSIDLSIPVPPLKSKHRPQSSQGNDSVISGENQDTSAYVTAAEDGFSPSLSVGARKDSDLTGPSKQTVIDTGDAKETALDNFAPLPEDFSDSDSFMYDQQRESGGGEGGLLFNEGIYGDAGQGLPGLSSMFSGQHSPPAPETPTSLDKPVLGSNHSTPGRGRHRPTLRHSLSTPVYSQRLSAYDYDFGSSSSSSDGGDDGDGDGDSDSFSRFAHPLPRGRQIMNFKTFEQDSSHDRRSMYAYVDEKDEDKPDSYAASKPKRDAKRRKRASTLKSQGKASTSSKTQYEDDGHTADMEY